MINYSYCGQYPNPVYLAPELYSYQFSKDVNTTDMEPPAFHYQNTTEFQDPSFQNPNNLTIQQCVLDFTVPSTMSGPVFMYYRLTNFYQNHRLYIKNYDPTQLLGHRVSLSTLHTNCDPLATNSNGSIIYPCGIVANSMFNGTVKKREGGLGGLTQERRIDTISNLTSVQNPRLNYTFSTSGIAWPTDRQKYNPTEYSISEIAPPPNWALRYPNGQYTEQYPPPDLRSMERFQVWMHMAALPDFRKIWARNDHDDLPAGRWRVYIDMSMDCLFGLSASY